jgi:hypothetical protein
MFVGCRADVPTYSTSRYAPSAARRWRDCYLNPDAARAGLGVIDAAEQAGKPRRGQTVIEATSGNTGVGLATARIVWKAKLGPPGRDMIATWICKSLTLRVNYRDCQIRILTFLDIVSRLMLMAPSKQGGAGATLSCRHLR